MGIRRSLLGKQLPFLRLKFQPLVVSSTSLVEDPLHVAVSHRDPELPSSALGVLSRGSVASLIVGSASASSLGKLSSMKLYLGSCDSVHTEYTVLGFLAKVEDV